MEISFLKKKWANPGSVIVYFHLFKQTLQFLQQKNVKKCPSIIRRWDLNSQPSDHETPPLTTRPGCLPYSFALVSTLSRFD